MNPDAPLPPLVEAARLREPSTPRGERTRATLVAAARRVFERAGYLDARLVDIAAEAGCSIGTFYTYFDGKDAVFDAVIHEVQDDLLHPGPRPAGAHGDPVAVIHAGNVAYLQAHHRHARIIPLLEQAALVDARWREVRSRRRAAFVQRNARSIRDLQARGLADPDLDPDLSASALSSMVSRLAVHAFGDDPDAVDDAALARLSDVATRLWTNAIGLTRPDLPRRTAAAHPVPTDHTNTPAEGES